MPKLCINIDHVATVREARKTTEPDPLLAAKLAIEGGADGITVHLREDRRHINTRDVLLLSQYLKDVKPVSLRAYELKKDPKKLRNTMAQHSNTEPQKHKDTILFTLEMAATNEILDIASKVKPGLVTLVPEKRQELTTEGGLDVIRQKDYLKDYVKKLHENDLVVSIFINANSEQIKIAKEVGADFIEVHTGPYANNPTEKELQLVKEAISFGKSLKLKTNAGHGLNYENIKPIARISDIEQLHIGHSIISRAVLVGIKEAVREMKFLVEGIQKPNSMVQKY